MMTIRPLVFLAAVMLSILLGGCQVALEPTELPAVSQDYWQKMQQKLATLSRVKLQGRIGYISRQERGSAGFDFEAQAEEFELTLYTTLAVQIARLTQNSAQAELDLNHEHKTAAKAEDLLYEATGLSLPASELKALFLGLPPGERSYDSQGKITGSRFKSYTLTYTGFKDFGGYALPCQFTIARGGDLIKVKVNQVWELN